MDRISHLPDFIVHHILSFIKAPEELVRMSVLSKNWFDLTTSFPILNFSICDFISKEIFFKYVEYTTSRFCHQNVSNAHTFKLITTLEEPAESDVINRCIELVLKNGVQVFDIDICYTRSSPIKYRLPNVLLSVSVLKSLSISDCELPSSLMVDVIQFKSLTDLTLEDVHIDDEVIKYLTTSCPLLQELYIDCCHGLKRFCVHGHQNLQSVCIHYNTQLEDIDIEASNLSELSVIDMDKLEPPQMNLASCKKLTNVTYNGQFLTNSNDDFLSNFPLIENLCLVTEYKGNKLKFSSHSLRALMLNTNCDLEEIELNAPNLGLFIYSPRNSLWPNLMYEHWLLIRDSISLKACMQCYLEGSIDALWFQKLRLFLVKKNGFKALNMYIHAVYSERLTELEKLKANELQPYELEHIELQLDMRKESTVNIALVDALLWCCRPQSLTLKTSSPNIDFKKKSDVVKFTFEKLLQQEDQGHTKIQIVSSSSSEAQKHHFRDWKLISTPLQGKTVSFIKEEVV